MQVWLGWLRWINPVQYGFESLMTNELVGRLFECVSFVPAGPDYSLVDASERVCTVAGSTPATDFVSGTSYLETSYGYQNAHKWRNVGVMIALCIAFCIGHLVAAEYVASERSKGEVLIFTREAIKKHAARVHDIETATNDRPSKEVVSGFSSYESTANIEKATSVFHWQDICYDVKIGDETRRILDHVDGWVKPGTLTALMVCIGYPTSTMKQIKTVS
jgi:hypothetical protein